jgi:hypothetical protein
VQLKDTRALQRGRRVDGFLTVNPKVAGDPSTPGIAEHHIALRDVIGEWGATATGQEATSLSVKGATAEIGHLTDLLRQEMRDVVTIARLAIPDVVKMTVSLQMPKDGIKGERLLIAADGLAVSADQYQDTLVKQGLPADGLARLRSVIQQLRAAIDARGQSIGSRRGSTEKITVLAKQAHKHVRTIDVLLNRVLKDNPALLAEWKQLKRVTIKGVPRAASAEAPDAPVTPVTPIDPAAPAPSAQEKKA